MTLINRLFLGFMIAAGLVAGAVLVAKPEARDFRISLIATFRAMRTA